MKKMVIEISKEEGLWKAREKGKPGFTASGKEIEEALGRFLWPVYELKLKARGIDIEIKHEGKEEG